MNIKLTMHLAQAQKWFTVRENETRKEKNGGGGGAQKTKQKKKQELGRASTKFSMGSTGEWISPKLLAAQWPRFLKRVTDVVRSWGGATS